MSLRRQIQAGGELPHGLTRVLAANGMQAVLISDGTGQPALMVQGHDSPVLTYALTRAQYLALTGSGSGYLDRKAYDTFAGIVSRDFDLPRSYVHARNVNSRVAMGLHGYRIGTGEYGRRSPMSPREAFIHGMPMGYGGPAGHRRGFWQVMSPLLGWGPRNQDGFHLRRIGGMCVTPDGAPIVPVRPDGRLKPGELTSGGYGFYWKGGQVNHAAIQDPLEGVHVQPVRQTNVQPAVIPEAEPYSELITSPVYFTAEKFAECLASHGLELDREKNELTVRSSSLDVDLTYAVGPGEMEKLLSGDVKAHSVEERLDIINGILAPDFKDRVTREMLESREHVDIGLTDEALAEIRNARGISEEEVMVERPLEEQLAAEVRSAVHTDGLVIPLVSEKEGSRWQQDIRHGRAVIVGNVAAYEKEGRYYLHADINGLPFEKELTQKEFQEIRYRNDSRRLELVDSHFDGIRLEEGEYRGELVTSPVTSGLDLHARTNGSRGWYREGADGREIEVGDISVTRHDTKYIMTARVDGETISHEISQKQFDRFLQSDDLQRMKLFARLFDEVDIKSHISTGAKVGAAIAATLTVMGEMTAAGPERGMPLPQGRAFYKPGVDSPQEIAARNFEAAMAGQQIRQGMHH